MASSLQVVDASTVVDGTGLKSAACLPPNDDKTYEIGPGCLLTTVFLRKTGKFSQLPSPRRGGGGGGKGRRQSHASTAEEREDDEDSEEDDDDDDQEEEEEEAEEEEEEEEEAHDDEEAAALRALGLPVSFGTSKSYEGKRASRAISPSPSPSASPARGVVSSSPSRINNKDNYKVGLCLYYQRPQGCSSGDSCTFAHGHADRKRAQRAKRAQAEQQAARTYTTVRRPRGADPLAYRPPYHGPPYREAMLGKYFNKRGWLWSHEIYDRGVKMDDDMWFSVTPFLLARHHASRLLALESSVSSSSSAVENGSSGSGSSSSSGCAGRRGPGRLVLDGFAGVGGDAAALAFAGARVVAVDLSLPRLEAARSNAELFFLGDGPSSGCADVFGEKQKEGEEEEEEELQQQKQKQKQKQQRRGGLFDVVVGDFFSVAPRLRVDCVFMSPPWGGPGYSGSDKNEE